MSGQKHHSAHLRVGLAGWLNAFDLSSRTKGRDYYSRGYVGALELGTDSADISAGARVRGSQLYECTVTFTEGEGWDGHCSCPVGFQCKHLYAVGTALLHALSVDLIDESLPPIARPASAGFGAPRGPRPSDPGPPPEETALVQQFTAANGVAPERKQLAYLRNLLVLHSSLRSGHYFNYPALKCLLPPRSEAVFPYYHNPFDDRWSRPPATAAELWSHLALLLAEKGVAAPPFMEKLTDLAWARAAVATHRREREIAAWRRRFAQLDADSAASAQGPDDAPPTLRALRLRLGRKKNVWEISTSLVEAAAPPAPADAPTMFRVLPAAELRDLLDDAAASAMVFEPASASFVAVLRAHYFETNRSTVKLTDAADCALLGRILRHPFARDCVVNDAGLPFTRDPRRLVWRFRDHPTDPDQVEAQLALADGTPAPAPLICLPGQPTFYLHGSSLFVGLPPPASAGTDPAYSPHSASQPDHALPVPIPRAALALPEAGRFASRAGLKLPNDTAGRFRHESLRPCVRAQLAPRRPDALASASEVLVVDLLAVASDGTPRAHYAEGTWHRSGRGLPPPPTDAAFLVLNFEATQATVEHFHRLPLFHDAYHPDGPRTHVEITASSFPETFANWIAGFPKNTLFELAPELAAFAAAPTRAHFAVDVTPGDESGIDWFDVRVTLRAEDTTLTPEEIAVLHSARGRFVRLAGHGWRRLSLEESPGTSEKLARLGLDPATAAAETSREPLRFHALQLADEAVRDALPEKVWQQVCARSAALHACARPPIPQGLVADLRPYQHEGFHFLSFLSENNFGGVLADDMGLGKTLQALAWLLALSARARGKKPFRVLVVCPKSVVVNWQLETARFAPGLATTAFTSALVTSRAAKPGATAAPAQLLTLATPLLVANYAQLRLHAEALASESWDAVILDEGQNIKNPVSSTAQAARALRAAHRLVLTGTPVENRLLDLWSLFAFAQPGLLGGQAAFKRLYNDKADPSGARTRLAQRVKHFLLRRTKSQVARDLPPRIEEELVVELEGPQRTLYDAELKRTRALLLGVKTAREFDRQRFNILQSLLRLRQICCDPRLVGAGAVDAAPPATSRKAARKPTPASGSTTAVTAGPPGSEPAPLPAPASAKLEALLDTLEPLVAEGHKVLVFSQFVTMLEFIRVELAARGIAHLMLTGQTENRQALVDRFQSDPAIPVFLLSLKAAGAGLNLTAASYVVLFDPWWNPAVEAQAIDRTHRIGQKNQVIAYRLIARDTIEQKIRALQREKAALAAAVVQEESLASVLDLDSLRTILA